MKQVFASVGRGWKGNDKDFPSHCLKQTQTPNGSNGADLMVRWVPQDPPHWQLIIATSPLIFFAIIHRNFFVILCCHNPNSEHSWEEQADSNGGTPSHQHHLLRKWGQERDGWGPVSTGKQSMAEPSHCTSQALVPLADGGCRKGQQPHAEVFGS